MPVFGKVIDFLAEKTQLMVLVKPLDKDKIDEKARFFIVHKLEGQPTNNGIYVPICLEEPLQIKFSISDNGNISKDLLECKCKSPVLQNEQLRSINQAYQRISQLIETHRKSHGGKVYDNVYFKNSDESWQLLDILREEIYEPYKAEFEEHQRIIKERIPGYVKPLDLEDKEKDELINALKELINILKSENQDIKSENQDIEKQLQKLKDLLEKTKLNTYREKLEEFKQRLQSDYPETKSPDSWQAWIYKNNWLFGIQYGAPIAHPQVGFRSIPDYLFPTPDGFIDILEIKKPSHEVIKEDNSHPGAFKWSGEVNGAIGQVVNYLHEIELHQLEIAKNLKKELSLDLSTIKPRAFILIGKSNNWSDNQKEAFRRLNHSLHEIEVLTYTDLFRRGENLIKIYGD